MGMRCITGESSRVWHMLAKIFGLPAPTEHDDDYYGELSGAAAQQWMHMGMLFHTLFYVEETGGSYAQRDYVAEMDPDGRFRAMRYTDPFAIAELCRVAGVMSVEFALFEKEIDKKYPLYKATMDGPEAYLAWYTPDPNEEDQSYAAWRQQEQKAVEEFRFIWG